MPIETHSQRYYELSSFMKTDNDALLMQFKESDPYASLEQIKAWADTINILKNQLVSFNSGHVVFEYVIPVVHKRIDVVFLHKGIVFIIEFKCGMDHYSESTKEQVLDYAYELHYFHKASRSILLVPIELPTNALPHSNEFVVEDNVFCPVECNKENLGGTIIEIESFVGPQPRIDVYHWIESPYMISPTIIQAARILYREHCVDNLKRHDSTNLSETIRVLDKVIESCKDNHTKAICFVTGVPGAGKTLVGLSLAIKNSDESNFAHSVFLSGNGPLVKTLIEALARDMQIQGKMSKSKATVAAESFIRGISKFRLDGILKPELVPSSHVVIFDEAQRAWNKKKLTRYLATSRSTSRYHIREYPYSEPESLIRDMDRHEDWAVIVCLVGGGQEIYDGEAGLPEWFTALRQLDSDWEVYVSPQINNQNYLINTSWFDLISNLSIHYEDNLHLEVSLRSLRTDCLNNFVDAILANQPILGREYYSKLVVKYPLVITRDFEKAKKWVIEHSSAIDRYGVVASSTMQSLLHGGKVDFDSPSWFLDDKSKPTSSFAMKYVASEFNVQGLELDYAVVVWGADLRYLNSNWSYFKKPRDNWKSLGEVKCSDGKKTLSYDQLYLKNAYRVLLTRSRKGMVIYIPSGKLRDTIMPSDYFDGTYQFLKDLGVREI